MPVVDEAHCKQLESNCECGCGQGHESADDERAERYPVYGWLCLMKLKFAKKAASSSVQRKRFVCERYEGGGAD